MCDKLIIIHIRRKRRSLHSLRYGIVFEGAIAWFDNSLVQESHRKMWYYVDVETFHSMCLSCSLTIPGFLRWPVLIQIWSVLEIVCLVIRTHVQVHIYLKLVITVQCSLPAIRMKAMAICFILYKVQMTWWGRRTVDGKAHVYNKYVCEHLANQKVIWKC
jgi:hypothetical protein